MYDIKCSKCKEKIFYKTKCSAQRAEKNNKMCRFCKGSVIKNDNKMCPKCSTIKHKSNFHNDNHSIIGLQLQCKNCQKEHATEISRKRPKVPEQNKRCCRCKQTKPVDIFYNDKYTPDRLSRKCKDCADTVNRQYRRNNKDIVREQKRNYIENNIQAKISHNLRTRVGKIIKNKTIKTFEALGCSAEELIEHLESRFLPRMNWENYGPEGWHVDHIIPLSSFDLTDLMQFKKACHYTNLQPLWARDNLSKGSKINLNQIPS